MPEPAAVPTRRSSDLTQCPRAQGGGTAEKKARGRGNAILPTRAPASFKRMLGAGQSRQLRPLARVILYKAMLPPAPRAPPAADWPQGAPARRRVGQP